MLHLRLRYLLLTIHAEVVVSFTFSIITALVAQHWETIPLRLREFMTKDEKHTKTESESPAGESIDKAEGKDTVKKSLGPSSEPATDSDQQPLFPGIRGRLGRREWDVV